MKILQTAELEIVVGGADGVWGRIGAEWASWYNGAVSATTDLFCAIDELDGSLAD